MIIENKIKKVNILIVLIIIILIFPTNVFADSFKKGEIVQFKEAATLYVRKQNNDGGYKVTKASATGKKGKKVTFQGEITTTKSIYDFSSASALRNKDIALISQGGNEYIVLLSKLGKVSSDSGSGSGSGSSGSGSSSNDGSNQEDDDAILDYDEDGSQTDINDAREEEQEEQENSDPDEIYTSQPSRDNDERTSASSIDDLMSDADDFVSAGDSEKISQSSLQDFSNVMYNILLTIGIVVAVIVGAIIGVKLMSSGIDTKVEAKKLLIPYGFGCLAVFGAFAIWKIVVTILQGV